MPDADSLRTAGKVLFRGLCTAGGILAPVLVLTDPSLPSLLTGLGAGTLAML
jgi:hypothetical protein